jgi:hypothetical protein
LELDSTSAFFFSVVLVLCLKIERIDYLGTINQIFSVPTGPNTLLILNFVMSTRTPEHEVL